MPVGVTVVVPVLVLSDRKIEFDVPDKPMESPDVNVVVVPVPKIPLMMLGEDALPATVSGPVLKVTVLGATGNKIAAATVISGFTAPAY